jgi:hypothetical protein
MYYMHSNNHNHYFPYSFLLAAFLHSFHSLSVSLSLLFSILPPLCSSSLKQGIKQIKQTRYKQRCILQIHASNLAVCIDINYIAKIFFFFILCPRVPFASCISSIATTLNIESLNFMGYLGLSMNTKF